ncbi:MAG: methyltransferase [Thermoproteales archaeon]|nr:methyltransferase [Thermoproteales archaeon]
MELHCNELLKSLRNAIIRRIDNLVILLDTSKVYNPEEDTYLFLDHVEVEEESRVLDMGTGCGIIGLKLARTCREVVGADINPYAVFYANLNALVNGIRNFHAVWSNLFSNIEGCFDYIVFNPPYLEGLATDILEESWYGGWRLVASFLREAQRRVRRGIFILVTEDMLPKLELNAFRIEVLAEKSMWFFEKTLLLKLEKKT